MISASHSLLLQNIIEHVDSSPDKTAIVTVDGRNVSYANLLCNIRKAGAWLQSQGICKGDRIMLSAQKEVEFVYLYFGAHLCGIVNVVVDASNNKEHLEYIASVVNPMLAVGMVLEGVRSIGFPEITFQDNTESAEMIDSDSIADIMFTSGTTGRPKGVCLTHSNISASSININDFIGNGNDDIEFLGLPICHSFGLGRLRCNMLTGGTIILHNGFANLKSVFSALEKYKVTGFGMVPAVWAYIKRFSGNRIGRYANQIKYIEIGSAAMPIEDKQLLLNLFPNTRICMHYGLTEASRAVFSEFHRDSSDLAAAGRSVSDNVIIRVMSDAGDELPPMSEGEICISGPMVTRSYFNPTDNEGAFFGDFFRTGDWGFKNEEGLLFLVARKKELINVGGKKVSPIEIEDALEKAGVGESMCVAVKDSILGEVPKALLLEGTFSKKIHEIQTALSMMLEPYKMPKIFEVVTSIPKTASGKKKRT